MTASTNWLLNWMKLFLGHNRSQIRLYAYRPLQANKNMKIKWVVLISVCLAEESSCQTSFTNFTSFRRKLPNFFLEEGKITMMGECVLISTSTRDQTKDKVCVLRGQTSEVKPDTWISFLAALSIVGGTVVNPSFLSSHSWMLEQEHKSYIYTPFIVCFARFACVVKTHTTRKYLSVWVQAFYK